MTVNLSTLYRQIIQYGIGGSIFIRWLHIYVGLRLRHRLRYKHWAVRDICASYIYKNVYCIYMWSSAFAKCDWRANIYAPTTSSSRRRRCQRATGQCMQQIMVCSTDFAHNTQSHTLFLIAANQRCFFPPTIPINIYISAKNKWNFRRFGFMALYILKLPIRAIMHKYRVSTIEY